MTEPLLDVESLRKEFGGLVAVNDVDFAVPHRLDRQPDRPERRRQDDVLQHDHRRLQADRGPRRLRRARRDRQAAAPVTERGIGRTFQNIRLFKEMTAVENVLVGMHCRLKGGILRTVLRTPAHRREERQAEERARELLAFCSLAAPRRPVRPQPPVRRPAPARGRPRARDRAEAAPARRADRRNEPAGDAGVHGVRAGPPPPSGT